MITEKGTRRIIRGIAVSAVFPAAFLICSPPTSRADSLPSLADVPFTETTSPAGDASGEPNLTVGDGTVFLSWIESPEKTPPTLKLSRWNGIAWGGPVTVVSDPDLFVNWADCPRFLILSDGTIAASWLKKNEKDASAWDLKVVLSSDGGRTWTPPASPYRNGGVAEHGFVSLVPDPVEGFWAIWLDGRDYAASESSKKASPETQLRAALWREGRFGDEVLLDKRVCDCCQTAAVRTLEGLAVAYRDRSEEQIRDISVVRYERRVWGKPFTVRNDGWKIDGCPVSGPSLAAQDRLLVMAWFTDAGDKPRVYAALSDSSSFGLSRIVQIDGGKPLGRVDVDWLPDGSALVGWVEQADAGAEIRARRVSMDGTLDAPFSLGATSADRSSGLPQLAFQGTSLWLAWTDASQEPARVRVGRKDLSQAKSE